MDTTSTKEVSNSTQKPESRGFKIAITYADSASEWNVSQWSALGPANGFNRHQHLGWSGKLAHISGFSEYLSPQIQEIIFDSDLVIVQRNLTHQKVLDGIRYFMGAGKPIVIHLDDGYWMLPRSNPAYQYWNKTPHPDPTGKAYPGGALKMMEEGIRLAHGLTCPNRLLLQDYSHLTKNLYYLQNYAEPSWWLGLPSSEDIGRQWWRETWWRQGEQVRGIPTRETLKRERGLEDKIIIGWGGSISHKDGWHGSGLREAAERVTKRHPNLIWLICGNDNSIYEHLPVPRKQKIKQAGVPPALWPRTVSMFDIGVAPLFGVYDQRRSWIKGIEYSLGGVPWIATEGEPYRDLLDWPVGMQGPEIPDFWEEAIEDTIANLKDRQEQAVNLQGEARLRFLVDNQLDTFAAVFRQVLTDFEDNTVGLPNVVWLEEREDGQ